MKRVFLQPLLWLSIALLPACASLSKEECLRNDWDAIGFRDGSQGYTFDRIHSHEEACRDYNIVPSVARYQNGRERGLFVYCTEEVGFREGEQGKSYQNVCTPQQEVAFMHGYMNGLDSAKSALELDLERKTDEVLDKSTSIARMDTRKDKKEREDALKELDRLENELDQLKTEHTKLIQLLERAQRL